MRIAVLIIGLFLTAGLFFQALLGNVLGDVANDEAIEQAGALGVFMAFLWLIAVALVIPFPRVSAGLFAVSILPGLGGMSDYPDLQFWSVMAAVLAVMSYFGYRGKRKQQAKEVERDDLMRQMAASQALIAQLQTEQSHAQIAPASPSSTVQPQRGHALPRYCRNCGQPLESGAQFCGECGNSAGHRSAV